MFDLPEVADAAAARLASAGLTDRVTAVGGDFFESVPAGADLYLACMVLHDWNDEQATRILRTERDWRTLLTKAGFTLDRIIHPPGLCALLETTRTPRSTAAASASRNGG